MPDNEGGVPVDDWLDRLRQALASSRDVALSAAEQRELLDLARIAAHRSERIAAPLTTFLVGVALADLPSTQRAERIAELGARMARG